VVLDERTDVIEQAWQYRERAFRQLCFSQNLADDERTDWRSLRGLQHERTSRRDRGRDLVRDQVQRKIERCDERTRADWHALSEAAIAIRTPRDLQVEDVAVDANGLLGRHLERVDESRHLSTRIADRLAGLDAECERELVSTFAKASRAMFEHLLS